MVEIEIEDKDISILSAVLGILTLIPGLLSKDLGGLVFVLISLLFFGFFLTFVRAKRKPS